MLGQAKSMAMTLRVSLLGGAYTRALKNEKSLAPAIPLRLIFIVVANDWCISGMRSSVAQW